MTNLKNYISVNKQIKLINKEMSVCEKKIDILFNINEWDNQNINKKK